MSTTIVLGLEFSQITYIFTHLKLCVASAQRTKSSGIRISMWCFIFFEIILIKKMLCAEYVRQQQHHSK